MRLLRFAAPAYGPFQDFALDLGGPQSFQVIFGPNESGKSSSLRAVRSLLYGIPNRTQDNFLFDYSRLSLAATLENAEGQLLSFQRRKGNRGTLSDEEGKTLPDEVLRVFLGGVGPEVFERLYGLNHNVLVEGGKELLQGGGQVGESLFAAGVGSGVHELLQKLKKDYEDLWTSSSTTRPLDNAIRSWSASMQEREATSLRSSEWESLGRDLLEAQGQGVEVENRVHQVSVHLQKLQRLKQATAPVSRLLELNKQLRDLEPLPPLREGFAELRSELQSSVLNLQERIKLDGQKKAQLQETLATLSSDTSILEAASEIEALFQQSGGIKSALAELPSLSAKLEQLEEQIRRHSADLGLGADLDQLEGRLPTAPVRLQVRALAEEHRSLRQDLQQQQQRFREQSQALVQAKRRLQEVQDIPDFKSFEEVLKNLGQAVHLQHQEQQLGQQVDELGLRQEQSLARLTGWRGGELAELRALKVPTRQAVETQQHQLQRLDIRLEQQAKIELDLEKKIAQARQSYTKERGGRRIPTLDELKAERDRRDKIWAELKGAWSEGSAFTGQEVKADLFLETVSKSDSLADEILHEAKTVARLEEIKRQGELLKGELAKVAEEGKALREEQARQLQVWRELWDEEGVQLRSPEEMLPWLAHREEILALEVERQAQLSKQAELGESLAQLRQRLLRAAEEVSLVFPSLEHPLTELLDRAQQHLQDLKEQAEQLRQLQAQKDQCTTAAQEAKEAIATLEGLLSDWSERWQSEVSGLGAGKDLAPEVLESLLTSYEELSKALLERQRSLLESARLQSQVRDFQNRLCEVSEELKEPLGLDPQKAPVAYCEELHRHLRAAQGDHLKRLELEEQLRQLDQDLTESQVSLESRQGQLQELLREAGVSEVSDLAPLEQKVSLAGQLKLQVEQLEETLAALSGGATISDFCAEVGGLDPDLLEVQLAEEQERLQKLKEESVSWHQRVGELRKSRESMDGSARAIEAAQKAEEHRAEGQNLARNYMRLRLAHALLNRQIEQYRQDNQGPLVEEGGQLFSRLTCGAYRGLEVGYGNGEGQVLLAVSREGRKVEVPGLSDGTRDQLFLALRLATILGNARRGEPFPLIADDLLVNFDTERARAALEVLQEVSQTTQVLLFTHLCRDKDLAQSLDPELTRVHTLERLAFSR